jgi:hypothetical protein
MPTRNSVPKPTPVAKTAVSGTARKRATKSVAKSAAKPEAKPASPSPAPEVRKEPKVKGKLVRDSFTMPQADFALIGLLKERAIGFKRPAKKSELLRAGLQALASLNDTTLKAALDALAPLKPGRPKKGEEAPRT